MDTARSEDVDHGRMEERQCAILPASRLADIGIRQRWSNLIAIIRIESKVYNNRIGEHKASMRY